jgi:serine phosphatase RsbU (regulator of sigma subunit)
VTDIVGHILVVDDHKTNRLKMSFAVTELGYTTEMAEDGRQALEMLRAEPFDLVLLDIVMPVMDGYQMLEEMKADSSLCEIPVIVISAQQEMESVVKGIELGAEDYLPRIFDPILLKARVGACLEKKRLRDQERKLQKQIQEANRRMERELALARDVQASFLPRELPNIPGWQVAVRLRSAREMSGDYYDVHLLPNGCLAILIADVVGKGAGAALFMSLSWTLMRAYAAEYPAQPELVLSAANHRILASIRTNQYVTLFYGILDPLTGTLVYSNAGHCPPYLVRASNDENVKELGRTGVPLGMFKAVTWEQATVQLTPGDVLVLYTDGVTEARNEQGLFFDEERLLQALRAHLDSPQRPSAPDIQDAVVRAVDEFRGNVCQSDDIALVVVVRD